VLANAAVVVAAVVLAYLVARPALARADLGWLARGYVAVVPFWLLTEAVGSAARLALLPFGMLMPPVHERPWRSRTLAEFWGRRWNRVFGDWFAEVCHRPLRRRPVSAVAFTFLVSGLWHELLVNVPLWLADGVNLFGTMMAYFLFQAAGLLAVRRRPGPAVRVVLWVVVLGPVPLVLNEGTLRIFRLVD
jgi:hypothetical protein